MSCYTVGKHFYGARRKCCYVTEVFCRTVPSVTILGDNTGGALHGRHMGDQNRKGTGKLFKCFMKYRYIILIFN